MIQPIGHNVLPQSYLGTASTSHPEVNDSSGDTGKLGQSLPIVGQTDTISLSEEALAALVRSDAIDSFLVEEGKNLYGAAIKNLKTYPEDLAAKLDDKSLSGEIRTAAANALNERELNAFTKYAKQSPPDMKMYYEKYIEYLDSLSPEEQQSDSYRGQRALVVPLYEHFAREQGEEPADLSLIQDPILILFEMIEANGFNVENAKELRNRYQEQVTPMFDRDSGPRFRKEADQALERFDAVQLTLDAARKGNETAFTQLQKLAEDASLINDFMSNAKRLTQTQSV